MYTPTTIITGFTGLVGWRQNPDANGTQLSSGAIASSSGTYYNDQHPMLTHDGLESVAPDYSKMAMNQAAINAAFSSWLLAKTYASWLKTIDDWFGMKYAGASARNLLEWDQLFQTSARASDTIASEGKFVGMEILPLRSRCQVIRIKEIGIRLTQNQTLTVLLFNPTQINPVSTTSIQYTGAGAEQWHVLTTPITLDCNQSHILGYNQSELIGEAVNGVRDYNQLWAGQTMFPTGSMFQCSACASPTGTWAELWDVADTTYTISTNYGINLRVSVECDYTAFIVEQKNLFRTAMTKRVALDLVHELSWPSNARENRHQAVAGNHGLRLMHSVEGDTQGRATGLLKEYETALKAIAFDDTRIDAPCLPGNKKRGIRVKSMTSALPLNYQR